VDKTADLGNREAKIRQTLVMAKFRRRRPVSFPEWVLHGASFLGEEEAKGAYGDLARY
jgi:hypothetical protein